MQILKYIQTLSLTFTADGASPGEPEGHLETGKKVLGFFLKTLL